MGSSTLTIATMAEDKKKSIKCLIKNIFGKKKGKENDPKEKQKETKDVKEISVTKQKETKDVKEIYVAPEKIQVETLLENFKKLEIEKKKEAEKKEAEDEFKNFSFKAVGGEELDNFTFKVVEDDRRTERTDSHSSQDSGFSEKDADERNDDVIKIEDEDSKEDHTKTITSTTDTEELKTKQDDVTSTQDDATKTDEVIESLQNLKIEDGKKKKSQLVPVKRGPLRHRAGDLAEPFHPYGLETQINTTINKQTLTGGHVIVANRGQEFSELLAPLNKESTSDELQSFSDGLAQRGVQFNPHFELDLVLEYIDEKNSNVPETNLIQEFFNDVNNQEDLQTIENLVRRHIEEENPIVELENTNHLNYDKIESLDSLLGFEDKLYAKIYPTPPSTEIAHSPIHHEFYNNFLTPPRSETMTSPMSESSAYPTTSDYTMSPNSDCEKYQEIPQFYEEYPAVSEDILNLTEDDDKKSRERNTSTSSLSMKNFKDMQKELAASYGKKDCCRAERKSCKELFQAHLKKLKPEERKSMCLKVSSMDIKTCYGVLHHILLGLSRGDVEEDLHLVLFALLCDKILGTKPQLFVEDFGLDLLKAATLRCPQRPLLTRNVVHCIRTAVKHQPGLADGKDCLFKEMDALGDTLVTACARAGDQYAGVLAELVRTEPGEAALFNVRHVNTEGYSALHVACREHSAASPRLHTTHVLLEHGGADIWKGDVKGGDTAVHMAVNASTCDLKLVLLLFRALDRKDWKKLAHAPNRSSVSPLDYARCAVKSATRQTYPAEVLDFLKKCR